MARRLPRNREEQLTRSFGQGKIIPKIGSGGPSGTCAQGEVQVEANRFPNKATRWEELMSFRAMAPFDKAKDKMDHIKVGKW